jgi:hypothetical protein
MLKISSRIAVVIALIAGMAVGCGDAGATITRLTVGTPGPDPYSPMSGVDQVHVVSQTQGGTKGGDTPGLYGGTRQASACDKARLVAFLRANPEKAQAWAGVQGIPVEQIPSFVERMTPVLLRSDTLVINHGYRNGEATTAPAVLQAGMGVMVDEYGTPTVKCNCGNPLTRAEKKISTKGAKYSGPKWPDFSKSKVTRVERSKGAVVGFVLVDPDAKTGFQRPRATEGQDDGPALTLRALHIDEPVETPSETPSPEDSGGPVDSGTPTPSEVPSETPSEVPTDVPTTSEPEPEPSGEVSTAAPPPSSGPEDEPTPVSS